MKDTLNHLEKPTGLDEHARPSACSTGSQGTTRNLHQCTRMFDLCHDLLILADCKNGRIVDANQTACSRLGYGYDQLTGMSLDGIFSSSVMDVVGEMLGSQSNGVVEVSGRLATALGENLTGEIRLQRIVRDDGCYLALVTRDISTQEKALKETHCFEKERVQVRRMEAIMALAGGLAHDFNNLLQVVSGNIQILGIKNKDEHLNRYIQAIDQAAITASTLVQRLRNISRKGQNSKHLVHLNDIIRETMDEQKPCIPERVRLDLELDADIPGFMADDVHLEQILLSLVNNALEALDGQGRIRIATCLRQVSGSEAPYPELTPGPYVQLTVADNGPGMSQEVQARIFEPFFTTKNGGQHAGLGMSIVHAMVREHGGQIFCQSMVRQGTRIRLFFPALLGTAGPS